MDTEATHEHTPEYCRAILSFNNSKIAEIDNKASFLTGISSIIFLLTAGLLLNYWEPTAWKRYIPGLVSLGVLLTAFIYAIRVVIPSTDTNVTAAEPPNDFFCHWITNDRRDQYTERVLKRSKGQTCEHYLNEVYTLAEILENKYHYVRRSSLAVGIAIVLAALQLGVQLTVSLDLL